MWEMIKRKKYFVILIAIVFLIIFIFSNYSVDGMEKAGIKNVKYRTFSNNQWTSWSKNGKNSGNYNDKIEKLSVKLPSKEDVVYSYFTTEDEWILDSSFSSSDIESSKGIKAIKLDLFYNLSMRYDICYRTYNSKDKWLNWSCNNEINGNANENILNVEIKIIPKNVIKSEYLKQYDTKNRNNIGF